MLFPTRSHADTFPVPIEGEVTDICVEKGQRVPAGTVLVLA